jgi:glycosyltransferase involved in cell wall biosynthesis
LAKRSGAATARNVGICRAKYNLLIFLDADMVIPNNFLREHLECHRNNNNDIISVGFRKHVLFDPVANKVAVNIYKVPSYKSDFRHKKYVPLQWKKQYPSIDKKNFGKNYYLLKETKNFLNFGYGKTVGIWTLPHMVVSSSIGVIAKNTIEIGGFDCRFKSAGYEDVHFGAKLICSGVKVVPIKNATAYHLVRNGAVDNETKVMARNRKLYYRLINEKPKDWSRHAFIDNFKKYETDIRKIS